VAFIGFTTGHVYNRQAIVPLCLAMALVFATSADARAWIASLGQPPPEPDGRADRRSFAS